MVDHNSIFIMNGHLVHAGTTLRCCRFRALWANVTFRVREI